MWSDSVNESQMQVALLVVEICSHWKKLQEPVSTHRSHDVRVASKQSGLTAPQPQSQTSSTSS